MKNKGTRWRIAITSHKERGSWESFQQMFALQHPHKANELSIRLVGPCSSTEFTTAWISNQSNGKRSHLLHKFYSFRAVLLHQDLLHEDEIDSLSLCVSSGSMIPSEKMNRLVALKMLAICRTIVWDAVVVGWTAIGRQGRHSGRNSFLLNVGAYNVRTARQNMNLQIQTNDSPKPKVSSIRFCLSSDSKKHVNMNIYRRKDINKSVDMDCFFLFIRKIANECMSLCFINLFIYFYIFSPQHAVSSGLGQDICRYRETSHPS